MSTSPSLKISIVTPCLNRAAFLEEAIASVQQQGYSHFEHIFVDGGSTDGTLELLARRPHLRVYSQPDEGIYDALNKGVSYAQGEVIGFLNTDDLYEPGAFQAAAQIFQEHPEAEAVVGGARIFFDRPGGERATYDSFPAIQPGALWARATYEAPIFNAWFFRKRLFNEIGGFDIRLFYVADREFLFRIAARGCAFISLEQLVYHYRMHPGSFTLSGQDSGEAGYMFESRRLAEDWLRQPNLEPAVRGCFREWHSQLAFEQIRTAWHRKALGRALSYLAAGMRYNPAWPRFFLARSWERLFRADHDQPVHA